MAAGAHSVKHSKGFLAGLAAAFDESKHKRGSGGKFASKGLSKGPKQSGSVGQAHAIFDKMKGQPKAEMLAAAKAAGLNPNTAKTQLYHWQKKQAAAALGTGGTHTKEELKAAAAKALGVKPATAPKLTPKPVPSAASKDHLSQAEYNAKVDKLKVEEVAGKYKFVTNPVPQFKDFADSKYNAKLGIAEEAKDWKIHRVKVSDILSDQPVVDANNLKKLYGKAPSNLSEDDRHPVIYRNEDGKYHILDGNHRVTKALLMGEGEISVRVLNVPPAPTKPSAKTQVAGGPTKTLTYAEWEAQYAASQKAKLAKTSQVKTTPPAPAPAPPPVAAPVLAGEKPDLAKLGPTKYVHALADHMKGAPKKDVMATAVKAGVNKSTASVQYHKWAKVKAGDPPQLAKSPEPAALKVKPADKMSDAELDKAIGSYQGKVSKQSDSEKFAAKPTNNNVTYNDSEGGKALTAKMASNSVYKIEGQNKTFYKDTKGQVHEYTGTETGPMKQLSGSVGAPAYHYDPNSKVVYQYENGVLKPVPGLTTPVWKNKQPPKSYSDHAFKDHSWAGANGVQNPDSKGANTYVVDAHAKAGVTYNQSSSAVKHYTGSGYQSTNATLRGSKGKTVSSSVQEIDDLIAKSSFKEETIMWRGVGEGGTEWNGAPPPPSVTDHAFTSTSFRPDVAKRFSDGKTFFRVRVPKGFPGLNVAIGSPGSGKAGLEGEAEVMMPRGTTYRVVARHKEAAASKAETLGYGSSQPMDVVDLEPVLPAWYIARYGQPKLG